MTSISYANSEALNLFIDNGKLRDELKLSFKHNVEKMSNSDLIKVNGKGIQIKDGLDEWFYSLSTKKMMWEGNKNSYIHLLYDITKVWDLEKQKLEV